LPFRSRSPVHGQVLLQHSFSI